MSSEMSYFSGLSENNQPPTLVRKMEAHLEYTFVYALHTCFCTFGANSYAQSVLTNKISALELSRKLIKSRLSAGKIFVRPDVRNGNTVLNVSTQLHQRDHKKGFHSKVEPKVVTTKGMQTNKNLVSRNFSIEISRHSLL